MSSIFTPTEGSDEIGSLRCRDGFHIHCYLSFYWFSSSPVTNANDLFAGEILDSSEGVKTTMNSIPSDTAFGDDEVNT